MDATRRQPRWWSVLMAVMLAITVLVPGTGATLAQTGEDVLIAPRGDAGQTGTMPGPGPTTAPDVLWEAPSDGNVIMGTAIRGDTLAFTTKAGSQGAIQAVDRATGEERWIVALGAEATVFGPTVTEDLFVVGVWSGDGGNAVIAFDAETGEEAWRVAFDAYPTAPTYAGDSIYVAMEGGLAADSALVALDAATGDERWRYDAPEAKDLGERVAVADGVVVVAAWSREDAGVGAYGFDAESGEVLWTFTEADEFTFDPVAANGVVLLTDLPSIWGVDLETGEVLWAERVGSAGGGPALVDGIAYYGLEDEIRAFDVITGEELWTTEAARIAGAPIVANGILYTAVWRPSDEHDPHVIHAVDADSGGEIWTLDLDYKVSGNQPLAVDGVLYVDANGAVVAYGSAGEAPPDDPGTGGEGGTYDSAEFGYTVTWEAPWSQNESASRTEDGQDFTTFQLGQASLAIRTAEIDLDAEEMLDVVLSDREGAFDDLGVLDVAGDETSAAATMTFTQGGIATMEYVEVRSLDDGTLRFTVLNAPTSWFVVIFAVAQAMVAIDGEPVFAGAPAAWYPGSHEGTSLISWLVPSPTRLGVGAISGVMSPPASRRLEDTAIG